MLPFGETSQRGCAMGTNIKNQEWGDRKRKVSRTVQISTMPTLLTGKLSHLRVGGMVAGPPETPRI